MVARTLAQAVVVPSMCTAAGKRVSQIADTYGKHVEDSTIITLEQQYVSVLEVTRRVIVYRTKRSTYDQDYLENRVPDVSAARVFIYCTYARCSNGYHLVYYQVVP